MRAAVAVAAVCLALIVIFFATPVLTNLAIGRFNSNYPPRSLEDVRSAAVASSASDLAAFGNPNVALSLSAETLEPLVAEAIRAAANHTKLSVETVEVELGEQTISFSTEVAGPIEELDATFEGTASGLVSVGSDATDLVFTPAIDRVQLDSLVISGIRFPGTIARATGTVLNAFVAEVNGQIDPIRVDLPAALFGASEIRLGDRNVSVPVHRIAGASINVDAKRLAWIAELSISPAPAAATRAAPGAAVDYGAFAEDFAAKGGDLLAAAEPDGVALGPTLVAAILGELIAPPSLAERARASLDSAWREAHLLTGPDLSLFLPADAFRGVIEPLLKAGIENAASAAGFTLSETRISLTDGAIGVETTALAEFVKPAPGHTRVRIGLAAAPRVDGAELAILPALSGIEILEASAEGVDAVKLLTALNVSLSGMVKGLNAALPAIPVELEPIVIDAIDLKSAASSTPGLTLTPGTVPATSIGVERAAVLVSKRGLSILADVAISSKTLVKRQPGTKPVAPPADVAAIEALFEARAGTLPDGLAADSARASASWGRIAELVNAHWADLGGIGVRYELDTGDLPMESTAIELVEKPTYSCDQNWTCSFHSCADTCKLDSCDWACDQVCTKVPEVYDWYKTRFVNRCVLKDPGCEVNKLACRAGRDAKYGACKLGCDTAANVEVAACQADANLKKAGCDVGRAIQDAASHVGGIGRIGGSARARGALATKVSALQLTTDHPGISFTPEISGALQINGSLEFTPYDIGHVLVCPAKGKTLFEMSAAIPPQSPTVHASLAQDPSGARPDHPGELALIGLVDSFTLRATIRPAPTEALIAQNPHLLVVCNPVIGAAVLGLSILGKAEALTEGDIIRALAGNEVAAILTGDLQHEVDDLDFPLRVAPPEFEIGEKVYRLLPSLGENAIWFSLGPA